MENDHAPVSPPENYINDGIDKEEFTLHYATIDNTVKTVQRLGSKALLAKIYIKCLLYTSKAPFIK